MAHKIAFSIETIDPKRREAIMKALADLVSEQCDGVDEGKITYTREAATQYGKRKITDEITINPGGKIDPTAIEDALTRESLLPMDSLWKASPNN